jgi:uncharacterized membrane protein YcaP (DUF421 family)
MTGIFQNGYVQIILRSLAVYFFVIIAIRFFGKKELAQLSVIDLVFILLISNSVQNAMVGPDTSLLGGILAALSLFVMNFLLKQLLYRSKKASEFLQGKALVLAYKGHLNEESLKKAEITLEELNAAIREHGVDDLKHVDLVVLEVDGNISVISDDFKSRSSHKISRIGARRKHKLKGRIGQA